MDRPRWLGFALLLMVVLAGCMPRGAAPGTFHAEAIPVPDEASQYTTAARPEGAVGGPGVERLEAEVAAAIAERGDRTESDGALSAAAAWALREVNEGRPIDQVAVEQASRHYGFGGVVLAITVFDMQSRTVWRDQLARLPQNVPITRHGVRMSPRGRSAAVLFGSVEIDYEPIPRKLDAGREISIRGAVGPRFASSGVYLTKPDGTVEEKKMPGRPFEASFVLHATGKYRLEVMGDGPTGPVVVSNVPLYVGVPEPPISAIAGAAVDPERAERRLLELLNQARAAARLNPLQPDPELREIAFAHSADMVDNDFVGHVSPTTGGPETRLRRSGALVSFVGENVAAAQTPELAHESLMSSPAHRVNMLRPQFTHVGIGASENENGLIVTMVFGRRPNPAELPNTAEQIEEAISALRKAKGLPPVTLDPIYRVSAQAGADVFAEEGDADAAGAAVQRALEREVNRRRTSRVGGCTHTGDILELNQLDEIPSLSLPALRSLGVGARLRRDEKGARLAVVILLGGVPCA